MKKKNRSKSKIPAASTSAPKKLNPFEVHVNRQKHVIIGKKSKADRGLPGIARSKAIKKRKATLLLEYKGKDKRNTFLDKRIGERNYAMTAEDKTLARFTAERMRSHSKKSVFNLGDDELLTHRGQSLTEIEKFEDPRSDEEDDEDEGAGPSDGKLGAKFVREAHFGGGMLTKVDGESKSRKDLIDQLIAESKKRKAEKQKMREETSTLTQKLDTEWKELLPLVTAARKKKGEVDEEVQETGKKEDKSLSYDVISKQLKFESRGKPSDKLKSEEQLAKEEKEKLETLEKDRIERMSGASREKVWKHKSADDLDDGFEMETNEKQISLEYDSEGKLVNAENLVEETKDEDNEVDMESEVEEQVEEDSGEEEEEDEDEDDNLSEFKESESDSDVDLQEPEPASTTGTSTSPTEVKPQEDAEALQKAETEEKLKAKKESMEKARNELPFTFSVPEEYEELEQLLARYNPDFQGVVVERMVKCSHPSLKAGNKDSLSRLFTFLLQHLQDSAAEEARQADSFKILDRIVPWLYDLTQWSPGDSAYALRAVIGEKYDDFMKRVTKYPAMDTLIFLKLVSILFPTSDYRHEVVTPTLLFMQHMLASCRVRASTDLATGLFLTTLVLEYTVYAKRFVPEAMVFLEGVLQLTLPASRRKNPPSSFKGCRLQLRVDDPTRSVQLGSLKIDDLMKANNSDDFRVRATGLALNLLSQFLDFWNEEPAANLIFEPFVPYLKTINFSIHLRTQVEKISEKINHMKNKKLDKLVLEKKKPKPLKLYEPNIEEVYSFKVRRPLSKEKQEREKLVYKYKKEMKGALREIRRDRTFLAKLKYKQTMQSDAERKRKVMDILGSGAQQAGELNKLKRKKMTAH